MARAGARSVSRLTSSSCRPLRAERPVAGGGEHAERDLAEVAADEDAQRVADRRPHGAPFDQGGDDGLQPVVGDHQVGGGPGRRGAALAEGDADVGQPDRRGVVGAVAGHRHGPPALLQRLDDPHLVCRGAAGHHVGVGQPLGERVVVELVEFGGGDHPLFVVFADGGGDRLGGGRMVAGDHDGVHAGLPDPAHRRGGALPDPVRERQEPHEGQPLDVRVGDLRVVHLALGDGQDPVPRPGPVGQHPVQLRSAGVVQRFLAAVGAPGRAARQHRLRGALHAQQQATVGLPDARVVTAGRLERQPAGRPPVGGAGLLRHPGHPGAAPDRPVGLQRPAPPAWRPQESPAAPRRASAGAGRPAGPPARTGRRRHRRPRPAAAGPR